MYLQKIKIRNFRLFQSLDLEFNQGLNVLVGPNDSGKTTLVDAIRYTLGTNSFNHSYISETDFHKEENYLTIQVKFSEVDAFAHQFVEHLSHEIYLDEEGKKKKRSVLYVQFKAEKTGKERRGYPYIKTEIRSGFEGTGLAIEAEIRNFLATTYLKPLRDAAAELSSGRTSRLSQILSSSKNVKDGTDDILKIIAEANDSLLEDGSPLKNSSQNIQNNFLHALIFEEDKEQIGAFIDIAGIKKEGLDELPENTKRRHLRAILEGLSLTLTEDRNVHGLGYHNLLFIAAELLLLEQEADEELPILLLEEPEAHLHPQLQMKLLQFLNSKIKSETNPAGIQCFVTTHSPILSSKADPSEIVLMGKGGAWALRPEETELSSDDYKFLRKFLDATKANVFFAKGVLFVEGDSENILIPEIAKLLGRPLENYGISIVKYDNGGSWKRFARLFLRKEKDENPYEWLPTKIGVLRDLDLWPSCAEKTADNSTLYGFKVGKEGNYQYWEKSGDDERANQIKEEISRHKKFNGVSLERQAVKIFISDRWTFEFCLARYGLFAECYEAITGSKDNSTIQGTDDDKAVFIQSKVSKTDFAYELVEILEKQIGERITTALSLLNEEEKMDHGIIKENESKTRSEFALALKGKLPLYITQSIEYLTAPIGESNPAEGGGENVDSTE